MILTAEQLVENYQKLISIITDSFNDERREKLLELYKYFEDRILYMPASFKDYYHSCYPGGYVVHVLNVIHIALELDTLWSNLGASKTYSVEQLIFSALNHDLGKVGDMNCEYYLPQTEDWKKKRGELYSLNSDLFYMDIADRSLFLLQQFEVRYDQVEFLAIKLHDGLYDEANKKYFISYSEFKNFKTDLPILIHHADHLATRIEYSQWKNLSSSTKTKTKASKEKKQKTVLSDGVKETFDNFFKNNK